MSATVASIVTTPAPISSSSPGDDIVVLGITPAQAEIMLTKLYDNQRPIVDRHVRMFADLYQAGNWRKTSLITVVFGVPSKNYIVVNGAHRLTMIARSGKKIDVSIRFVKVADANLLREAEAEYRMHDANEKARSSKDLLWSFPEVRALGLDPNVADKVAKAANYINQGFPLTKCGIDMKNRSVEVRVAPLIKYVESAKKYLAAIDSAKKTGRVYKELTSTPLLAAGILMYETCGQKHLGKLNAFLYTISTNDGVPADDPRALLLNLMFERWRNSAGKTYDDVDKAIIFRKVWNAHLLDEKPQRLVVKADNRIDRVQFLGL